MKTVFHFDLDAFFVSAERLRNKSLLHKPVAVGGLGGRGVIASCSYEARARGVRSAMPMAQALRLIPELQVVPPDFEWYSALSKKVFEQVRAFSPIVEQVSIDEGYLDYTGCEALFGKPLEAAKAIRAQVLKQTGLTLSIGMGSNRMIAKIATDQCKPDGVLWVQGGNEASFLAPLPVQKIQGVGAATQKQLNAAGFFRIGDLQKAGANSLKLKFGNLGEWLSEASQGIGATEFFREAKKPSISRERTFEHDVYDPSQIEKTVKRMVRELALELRESKAETRTLKIKLRNPQFETCTRMITLPRPSHLESELFTAVWQLLLKHWLPGQALRLVGVGFVLCSGKSPGLGALAGVGEQLDLFLSVSHKVGPAPEIKGPGARAEHLRFELRKKLEAQKLSPELLKLGAELE